MDSKSIARLDPLNLLAVYDVLLDLEEEFNIASARGSVTIRLWNQGIRFSDLHPGDGVGIRDAYCERRWKVLNYLKEEGVILHFELLEGSQRWEDRITAVADSASVRTASELVAAEYENRRSTAKATKSVSARKVFIGHGRSSVWRELKDFLADNLKLECVEFNSESAAGVSTKERLEEMLDQSGFAFLVFTAEDERLDGTRHARENVIHECGLFQGRLGFRRAIVLLEQGCAEFSNIHGLTHIAFPTGNITAAYEEIRRVLKREGLLENG